MRIKGSIRGSKQIKIELVDRALRFSAQVPGCWFNRINTTTIDLSPFFTVIRILAICGDLRLFGHKESQAEMRAVTEGKRTGDGLRKEKPQTIAEFVAA